MPVPFIDLKRFEDGLLDSWIEKVRHLSENTAFIGGAEVAAFEETLKAENGVGYAIGCANGTDALQLALRAVGVGPGDRVLLPNNTFWATFEAVVNVSATPATVDIDPADLQMDFENFKAAVADNKPKAAILVHLYGWASARLAEFRSFCKEQDIALIEDGAQCYSVKVGNDSIYKDALISTISFYPAKVFGAAGDAGAVLTSDAGVAEKVRSLANHGREEHYAHGSCGWNSRMDSFQAAYLNLCHPHLQARIKSRQTRAQQYRERLGAAVVGVPAGITENGYLNAVRYEPALRDKVTEALKAKQIGFGIVYPQPVAEQKGAQGLLDKDYGCEQASILARSVVNLPLFPYMDDEQFEEVVATVKSVTG